MLDEKERADKNHSPRGSRPGSISDILAAFPSPSISTPTGDRPGSRWQSSKQKSGLSKTQNAAPGSPISYDEKHRSRKCCGMPIWAFALLTIILILLIAAAVIIPVTLIVLPKTIHLIPTPASNLAPQLPRAPTAALMFSSPATAAASAPTVSPAPHASLQQTPHAPARRSSSAAQLTTTPPSAPPSHGFSPPHRRTSLYL